MRPCSRDVTKWKKRGPSSTRSKKRGAARMRHHSICIRLDRGDRTKRTNCSPGTAAAGGDYSMPATHYSLGQQVEIGNVQAELKRLWKQGEGAMARASLINLAVYSEAAGSLEENTQIVAR